MNATLLLLFLAHGWKVFWIVLAMLVLALASWSGVNYLLQKRRQDEAQRDGVVVYATVLSIEPVTGWARQLELKKIVLRVQEPGVPQSREVTLRSRTAPGQKIVPGVKLAVVVDPKDPKRIYPANPEAAKRIQITGSREERRQMKAVAAGKRPGAQRVTRNPGPMPGIREKRR